MISRLIAYQLAEEHQRELTDQAQQRVLAHLANDALNVVGNEYMQCQEGG
jgi:hypothetical protein